MMRTLYNFTRRSGQNLRGPAELFQRAKPDKVESNHSPRISGCDCGLLLGFITLISILVSRFASTMTFSIAPDFSLANGLSYLQVAVKGGATVTRYAPASSGTILNDRMPQPQDLMRTYGTN